MLKRDTKFLEWVQAEGSEDVGGLENLCSRERQRELGCSAWRREQSTVPHAGPWPRGAAALGSISIIPAAAFLWILPVLSAMLSSSGLLSTNRHGATREGAVEDHKDDEGSGASLLQGETAGAESV